MSKSKRSLKRRIKLKRSKGTKVTTEIYSDIKEKIQLLTDVNIPLEERRSLQEELYDKDGKLKKEHYKISRSTFKI